MCKVIRAFYWHQHLSPRGCLPLPWGYIHIYQDQMSGERLQDHWSTFSLLCSLFFTIVPSSRFFSLLSSPAVDSLSPFLLPLFPVSPLFNSIFLPLIPLLCCCSYQSLSELLTLVNPNFFSFLFFKIKCPTSGLKTSHISNLWKELLTFVNLNLSPV